MCSWKYHRKHIFYLLLAFSQLPNKYIISFIPQYRNTNKTQKKKNIIKSGQFERRRKRERQLGSTRGEITRRGTAIAIGAVLWSRSMRRRDRDRHDAAMIRPSSKGRGRSRKREIGSANWELNGAISPLRLGLGRCVCESFFLSLFFPLHVSVPEVFWRWNKNEKCFYSGGHILLSTEVIFRLTQFSGPTKQPILRKSISEISLKSKQTQP